MVEPKTPKKSTKKKKSKYAKTNPKRFRLTGADPIADAGEPLGVGGGVDVDEEARLLTAVAEGPEGVVPVLASSAFPVPFSPFSHS